MITHIAILIALSFILLIFIPHAKYLLQCLDGLHSLLNSKLSYIFNTSPFGNTTQETICLLLIPFIIAALPAAIFWLFKRKLMPYFYHVVWGIWIVLFTSLILTH